MILIKLLAILLLYSCSQVSTIKPQDSHTSMRYNQKELISTGSALNLAQSSYLKGCVDATILFNDNERQKGQAFNECREKSSLYMDEILEILNQEL